MRRSRIAWGTQIKQLAARLHAEADDRPRAAKQLPLVVPSSRPDAVCDALDLASRNAGSWAA
jgi:hypothetical protein